MNSANPYSLTRRAAVGSIDSFVRWMNASHESSPKAASKKHETVAETDNHPFRKFHLALAFATEGTLRSLKPAGRSIALPRRKRGIQDAQVLSLKYVTVTDLIFRAVTNAIGFCCRRDAIAQSGDGPPFL